MGRHLAPAEPGGFFAWLRVGVITVLFVLAAMAGFIVYQAHEQKKSPAEFITDFLIEPPQAHFAKDHITVLLLGIDYNYDTKDQEFSAGARSDTIMVASLNFPTPQNPNGSVNILSVPRDMKARMPDGSYDKINGAYSVGGAKSSEKVVASFLGIPGFDRYVTLRIDATKSLIDAIGGIDVVADKTMDYDDSWGHLHIHFVGGKLYHMNGDEAVSYSRFRHDECGDPCRIKRQQQVLRITLAKLRDQKFNDLLHISSLIDVVRRNVDTNFTDREALSLASAFSHIDLASVKTDQVPYVSDEDLACCGNVIIADDAAKAELVKTLLTPPTPAPDPAAIAAIPAASIHIDVRNGSGQPGVAAKVAAALRAQGFKVDVVGDADSFAYDATQVHEHSATPGVGARVLAAVGLSDAGVTPDPVATGKATTDVTVIVGRDYSRLGATPGASPAATPQAQASVP